MKSPKLHLNFLTRYLRTALFCFAAALALPAAFAQTDISGSVKGTDGRPAAGAEVRIQRQDKRAPDISVRTDASGKFTVRNVAAGDYAIAATAGKGPASVKAVRLAAGHTLTLNIDMRTAAAEQSAQSKQPKRMVYVPPPTGSRIGGGYEERDDSRSVNAGLNNPTSALERLQRNTAPGGGQ
jgi:hypothetical protein